MDRKSIYTFPLGMTYRACGTKDAMDICNLQKIVFAAINDKTILRENTYDMFLECASSPHYTLGVWKNDSLIAITILFDPVDNVEENLSVDIQGIDTTAKTVNYKLTLVHPEHRGQGLQRLMSEVVDSIAKDSGAEYICCTVSPDNIISKKNLESFGYKFSHSVEKYSGLLRHIMYKKY